MKEFNTGMKNMSDRDEQDRLYLSEIFGDKAEEYKMDVLEDRHNGFSIIGYYPKNTFILKEDAISEIKEALDLDKLLNKDYKYTIQIPYLAEDLNIPFVIDLHYKGQENSSKQVTASMDAISKEAIIRDLISEEHSASASYLKAIELMKELGENDIVPVLESINKEELVHLGELQVLLGNSGDEEMADGIEEAVEIIEEESTPLAEQGVTEGEDVMLSSNAEEAYEKYINDFKKMPFETFKKEYSCLRHKKLTNKGNPLSKEEFEKIYTSSMNVYQVNRKIATLNRKLDDLELVMKKDEDGDIAFFIINPEANIQEYLEVLEWLDDRGVDVSSYNSDIEDSVKADTYPELVELGYGGGDTAIVIWHWKELGEE